MGKVGQDSGRLGESVTPTKLSQRRLDPGDALELTKRWSLHFDVEHLHGPEEIERGPQELVVVCLVRDGRPFIRSFLDHYFSLGAKHVVFLDNGSNDGMVEDLAGYDNVTVLRTGLPFVEYQFVMKRYLVERFGRDRWTLCVDVDELFDYPYSDVVSLGSFLGYLSENGYTAVASQMLDMFPEEPLHDGGSKESDEPLKERHRFYDTSSVTRQEYRPPPGSKADHDNVISNSEIDVLQGGVKKNVFGYSPILTKHPLVFHDGKVKPFDNSAHWASGAYVANLTCVLFHYTFLEFLYERLRRDLRESNYFSSGKFQRLSRVLEGTAEIQVKRETSKEFGSVNDLADEGFLTVSEGYMKLVDKEEGENPPPETLRRRPYRLAESFSRARERKMDLMKRASQPRLHAGELESEVREERQKARRIGQRNTKLETELRSVEESRAWKILGTACRIRGALRGRRRGG